MRIYRVEAEAVAQTFLSGEEAILSLCRVRVLTVLEVVVDGSIHRKWCRRRENIDWTRLMYWTSLYFRLMPSRSWSSKGGDDGRSWMQSLLEMIAWIDATSSQGHD